MSAIGGVFELNGAFVQADLLRRLGDSSTRFGPDGAGQLRHQSIGMVHCAFHTNQLSKREEQPLVDDAGHVLAWDGRLDNRKELLEWLGNEVGDDAPDVLIVLAAFRRWGEDFPQRLIGDFALSLWDPKSQTLCLARDQVGARLLFYHVNEERLVWSSRLEALLGLPDVELEVDDEYVAGYFTTQSSFSQTPYKNIFAVPPAHILLADAKQVRSKRFWGLDPHKQIRYATDAEYEEHFRQLFRESVQARLRVDGPVWADLSGGLDSSSVVCMADSIIESREADAARLETVSAVFDESPSSDERRFIAKVEARRGRPGHHFKESEHPLLSTLDSLEFKSFPNLLESWSEYHKAIRRTMRADGARVLLTGIGGDELLTASVDPSVELVDLLVQKKWLELHRRTRVWSLSLKKPYLNLLWRHALSPTLPTQLQLRNRRRELSQAFGLLNRNFIKRFDLAGRLIGPNETFGFSLPSSRGQAAAFLSVAKVISSGSLLDWDTVEISYPFSHRPLVEFLQAIPPTQWIRPGQTRSLMRRSLRTYLPEEIQKRKSKGSPTEATFRALAREWPRLRRLMRNTRIAERGYVDEAALNELIKETSIRFEPAFISVIRLCHLEIWLRNLEAHSRARSHATASLASESVSSINQREKVFAAATS